MIADLSPMMMFAADDDGAFDQLPVRPRDSSRELGPQMDEVLSQSLMDEKPRRPAEVSDDEGLYEWDALWRDPMDDFDLVDDDFVEYSLQDDILCEPLSVSPDIRFDEPRRGAKRKQPSDTAAKPKMPRKNNALSEAKWAEERAASNDPTMPEKRPVGISLASGSSSGWRLRISGTQLGHYATAQQAWEHYPRTPACKAKLTREHQGKAAKRAPLVVDDE